MSFIIKAVVDALQGASRSSTPSVRGNEVIYRKHDQRRHRRRARLGPHRPGDQERRQPVADRASPRSLNDLASRARNKQLKPREVQDGTFTITNPGVFGSLIGTPIINQPQVAILCIGGSRSGVKVVSGDDGEDTIAIRTCAYLSLSFDHRIVDGADADRFMALVKKTLENFPETVL